MYWEFWKIMGTRTKVGLAAAMVAAAMSCGVLIGSPMWSPSLGEAPRVPALSLADVEDSASLTTACEALPQQNGDQLLPDLFLSYRAELSLLPDDDLDASCRGPGMGCSEHEPPYNNGGV